MNNKFNLRDERKGQSAIEYLTTYGWMLLVIAIVGGSIFTVVQDSSQIESTSGLANADVQIENFGVTSNGLSAEVRAASSDQIEDLNLSLIDKETGETVYSEEKDTIPVAGTETFSFPDAGSSENTNTYEIQATYDTSGLEGLTVEGTITGRIAINGSTSGDGDSGTTETSSDAVLVSGDSITAMATSSTFLNNSGEICVGPDCSETSGSETDEYVSRSGDEMTGTLYVDNITDLGTTCFGDLCNVESGSNIGFLGEEGEDMDGTLNITEIKPDSNSQICAGTEC